MKFSEKLIRLRRINGITQEEFANKVGVSRQAVYKWESGQSYPEVPKLIEIKNLFGLSIDSLLDENFEIALPEKKKRKRAHKVEAAAEEIMTVTEDEESSFKEENEEPEKQTFAEGDTSIEAPVVNKDTPSEEKEEVEAVVKETVDPEEVIETKAPKKKGFFERLFGRR